jgi:hypothetical protein
MNKMPLFVALLLVSCNHVSIYTQGESVPGGLILNHNTTWNINGTVVDRFDPAGNITGEPNGWKCKYSTTVYTTSGYNFRWLTCTSVGDRIDYSLTCKSGEEDYREFQISLRHDRFISATCTTTL